ncbi:MAG TPA: thioredoxin family protein, partial [Albitalea sp.]
MNARPALAVSLVAAAIALGACSKRETPPAQAPDAAATATMPVAAPADGIAWRQAASDADVDAAFAEARRDGKPLFLYWGAKWCPPCNQVKATLFNRVEFIERSRAFVPVYVDGDRP